MEDLFERSQVYKKGDHLRECYDSHDKNLKSLKLSSKNRVIMIYVEAQSAIKSERMKILQ